MENNELKRYLGIDWGEKRIGLAQADSETKIALPFKTAASLSEVLEIITDEEIDAIVIGSPRKMSGAIADNPLWQKFLTDLEKSVSCEIIILDERLSSLAADALEGGKKDKAARDEIAAALILQQHLDKC